MVCGVSHHPGGDDHCPPELRGLPPPWCCRLEIGQPVLVVDALNALAGGFLEVVLDAVQRSAGWGEVLQVS